MKRIICALSVLIAGVVMAVDWPSDVLTNIDAAEAAWPTAVTSAQYSLAAEVPQDSFCATGTLATSCDTFVIWLSPTCGISFNSDIGNGLTIIFK